MSGGSVLFQKRGNPSQLCMFYILSLGILAQPCKYLHLGMRWQDFTISISCQNKYNTPTFGRNHVNETARHGIIAHRLWEENLGNVTEVFVNDSFGFPARSLWFRCPNAISESNNCGLLFSLLG